MRQNCEINTYAKYACLRPADAGQAGEEDTKNMKCYFFSG